jgi:lipopolysaccharide transport system permease protein
MNSRYNQSASLIVLAKTIWANRSVISQLTVRESTGKYKGSVIGLGWSLFHPILMLAVYTFVFSVIFKSRWAESATESRFDYAIIMFVGIIIHGILSDVFNKASTLITSNVNYVKKVVFPLEILPIISLGAALFHAGISLLVLLTAYVLINGTLQATLLLLPIIILPFLLLVLGLAWIIASLGVFIRDTSQTISIITLVMLFLAPVFYSVQTVPEDYRALINLNPLTFIIEQSRNVIIFGKQPDWTGLLGYSVTGFLIFWFGYMWFQKTKKGFADVI